MQPLGAKIVIRKYENRRLYDTTQSRYVNLDDVAAMIRSGADLQVVDARTNRDVTRTVLTQIIVEETKGRELGLPLELLRQLVLVSDTAGHQFLEWYLKNAMDAYQKVSDSLQMRFQEVQHVATNPVETILNLWRANPFQGEKREVEALHRRVEELEKRLADQTKAKPKPRQKRASRSTASERPPGGER
jgi:polyhydroxyalkanoate synthesis repressor PhaR